MNRNIKCLCNNNVSINLLAVCEVRTAVTLCHLFDCDLDCGLSLCENLKLNLNESCISCEVKTVVYFCSVEVNCASHTCVNDCTVDVGSCSLNNLEHVSIICDVSLNVLDLVGSLEVNCVCNLVAYVYFVSNTINSNDTVLYVCRLRRCGICRSNRCGSLVVRTLVEIYITLLRCEAILTVAVVVEPLTSKCGLTAEIVDHSLGLVNNVDHLVEVGCAVRIVYGLTSIIVLRTNVDCLICCCVDCCLGVCAAVDSIVPDDCCNILAYIVVVNTLNVCGVCYIAGPCRASICAFPPVYTGSCCVLVDPVLRHVEVVSVVTVGLSGKLISRNRSHCYCTHGEYENCYQNNAHKFFGHFEFLLKNSTISLRHTLAVTLYNSYTEKASINITILLMILCSFCTKIKPILWDRL